MCGASAPHTFLEAAMDIELLDLGDVLTLTRANFTRGRYEPSGTSANSHTSP